MVLKKVFLGGVIALGLWILSFIAIECMIGLSANTNDTANVKYLIILGAGLYGDKPSLSLYSRLYKALEVIPKYPDAKIIVSGGQGVNETISEAEAMKRFFVQNGIDENKMILEDMSTNTRENFLKTKMILQKSTHLHGDRILIITSDYHMFRSKLLAKRAGFLPYGVSAQTPDQPYYLKPYNYIREYFAVVKSYLFD